jgi:hypothetical protein
MHSPLRPIVFVILAIVCFTIASAGKNHVIQPLSIAVTLSKAEVLRGESVYFSVVIENKGTKTLEESLTLTKHNRALTIQAKSVDHTFTANEYDILARDGDYSHGPKKPDSIDLTPHAKLTQAGDLLTWLGEMPPGKYQVTAEYSGADRSVKSEPIPLHVKVTKYVALDSARPCGSTASSPLASAFVADDGGGVVIAQLQSQMLPRNPRHGLRVGTVAVGVRPFAAQMSHPSVDAACAVWMESPDRLSIGRGRASDGYVAPAIATALPFKGEILASPLCVPDGRTFVPFADLERKQAAVLEFSVNGSVRAIDLPPVAGGVGASAFLWYLGERVDAVWAAPGGREVSAARASLSGPDAKFMSPATIGFDDPVIWVGGFIDPDAPRLRTPPDLPVPAPDAVAWVVTRARTSLLVSQANLSMRVALPIWTIAFKEGEVPDVLSGIVTKDNALALILRQPTGELLFASTASRTCVPLSKISGSEITATAQPGLLAASSDATRPWVYVHWIASGERIAWAKLEPVAERDPSAPRPPEPTQQAGNDDELMPRDPNAKDEH